MTKEDWAAVVAICVNLAVMVIAAIVLFRSLLEGDLVPPAILTGAWIVACKEADAYEKSKCRECDSRLAGHR